MTFTLLSVLISVEICVIMLLGSICYAKRLISFGLFIHQSYVLWFFFACDYTTEQPKRVCLTRMLILVDCLKAGDNVAWLIHEMLKTCVQVPIQS